MPREHVNFLVSIFQMERNCIFLVKMWYFDEKNSPHLISFMLFALIEDVEIGNKSCTSHHMIGK